MAQTYPLDRVIRKVPPNAATAEAQQLVIVDVKDRVVLPRPPLLRSVQHYLVSNRSDPAHESRIEIPAVVLADLDARVEVSVSLLVSCPRGREAQVAMALFDPADAPGEVLERRVVRRLREMGQGDVGAFARRFVADPAVVQQALAEAVGRETGLSVQARLSLEPDRDRDPVRVEVAHLSVLVRDWDEEQDLGVRADLEVGEESRADAVLNRARVPELHLLVPREIRAFVRRHVSLAEFPGLASREARQALVAHLNEVLRPVGRRVGALVLRPGNATETEERSVLEEVAVACTVRGYATPVSIGNRVLVRVVDLVKYRAAGSPDLRAWLRATLERLIPVALFAARYTDLLLRFEEWEERIKLAVRAAAEEIGCEISQFITDPDLPEKVLVEPFVIRTEGDYQTRQRGVDAKLEVVVTARIPRLEEIAPLLGRERDVPGAMEKAVGTAIAVWMHGLHPERFYMRFGFTDPEGHAEETQSVEAELVQLVERRLRDGEFHAEVLGTVIKILETDFIRRFRELQEATPDLFLSVESLDAQQVDFTAGLRVVAVHRDGWQRFCALTGGIEQITEKVRGQVATVLHTLPAHELLYRTEEERSALEGRVAGTVLRHAVEQFGLVVQLFNLRRGRTRIETGYLGHLLEEWTHEVKTHAELEATASGAEFAEFAAMAAAMERLAGRHTALCGMEGEDEEREWVEREMAALKARMAAARSARSEQMRRRAFGAPAPGRALPGAAGGADAGALGVGETEP